MHSLNGVLNFHLKLFLQILVKLFFKVEFLILLASIVSVMLANATLMLASIVRRHCLFKTYKKCPKP